MKTVRFTLAGIFTGLLLTLGLTGCKPSADTGTSAGGSTPPSAPTAAVATATPQFTSAHKNSFSEVTAQIDPGGVFYMYLGTAQWLDGLSTHVGTWQASFDAMPQLTADERTNVDKAFATLGRVIQASGIEDATGVGISSIETEPGFYRNKFLLHHYPGHGQGFLWNLLGSTPHPLDGLNFLPTNTALASFSDVDLPLLWSVITNQTALAGFPEAQAGLQSFPAQFEQQTQVKWDQFLNSLGGEIGVILTLNESNRIALPIPGAAFEIPEPGLAFIVKVKDDTIFNRIDQQLKQMPGIISTDTPSLKMRTMPVPLPLPLEIRATAASAGGYLLIGTTDDLIQQILAVQHGDLPGIKSTEEFKHLSHDLPDQGNHFTYVSARFGRAITDIQHQAMNAAGAQDKSAASNQWLQNLLTQHPAICTYSVGAHTENGYLIVGNGTQSGANLALIPAAAFSGMMAAIAVPNFVKARATAQENACINNLRQIDAAKQQWALEKTKPADATPTQDELLPYLPGNKWPTCPAGGTYTINPVNQHPTCSIDNHHLD